MKNLLLFRVDGGKIWGVSTGHMTRMLLLAKLLKSKFHIKFVMKNFSAGVKYVKEEGFNVETIDTQDDSDATLISFCEKFMPKKVIFDLYANFYQGFFDYARKKNIRTIVFDVVNQCPGIPDVLINDSLVEAFTARKNLADITKVYRGPDYFLFDNSSKLISIKQEVKEIMLTLGGSDPANLTLKILKVLLDDPIFRNCSMNVVLGPLFSQDAEVFKFVNRRRQVRILKAPLDFLNILSKQDIVITAAGRTLYECAYFGRPAIIIPSIEHEAVTSVIFSEKAGFFDLGLWNDTSSPAKLIKSFSEYMHSYALRCGAYNAARRLVDGFGKERILDIIGS